MASPLHDNKRSPKKEETKELGGAKEKKPDAKEPVNDKGETQGEERENDPAPGDEERGGGEPMDEDSDKADPGAKFFDQLKNIHKRQDTERGSLNGNQEQQRRDLHGSHRSAHREMADRHAKELKDHMADMPTPDPAGQAPAGGPAPAGGVPAAAPAAGAAAEE